MWNKKPGMTLVEVLIGLAVGSIVIGASFFVITQFSKQYQISSDYIEISQNARYSLYLMKRDIRMAGYKDPESPFGVISDAVNITDSDVTCCDKITIIYDKDKATRLKIIYEVINYLNGKQLVKSEYHCEVNGTCSGIDGNWQRIINQDPVSKDISNLQFINNNLSQDHLYIANTSNGYIYVINKLTGELSTEHPAVTIGGVGATRGYQVQLNDRSQFAIDNKEMINPNINIEMQISLEKNYINKKIEETFYSSATVRNF